MQKIQDTALKILLQYSPSDGDWAAWITYVLEKAGNCRFVKTDEQFDFVIMLLSDQALNELGLYPDRFVIERMSVEDVQRGVNFIVVRPGHGIAYSNHLILYGLSEKEAHDRLLYFVLGDLHNGVPKPDFPG